MTQSNDMPKEIYASLDTNGTHCSYGSWSTAPFLMGRSGKQKKGECRPKTKYIRADLTPPQSPNRAVLDSLTVTSYSVIDSEVSIEIRRQMKDSVKWVAALRGEVLNKQGEWEYEPLPSNRDDEFIERTRFDSPESCLEHLKRQKGR